MLDLLDDLGGFELCSFDVVLDILVELVLDLLGGWVDTVDALLVVVVVVGLGMAIVVVGVVGTYDPVRHCPAGLLQHPISTL